MRVSGPTFVTAFQCNSRCLHRAGAETETLGVTPSVPKRTVAPAQQKGSTVSEAAKPKIPQRTSALAVECRRSPGTGLNAQQGCAFGIRGGVVAAGGVAIPWLRFTTERIGNWNRLTNRDGNRWSSVSVACHAESRAFESHHPLTQNPGNRVFRKKGSHVASARRDPVRPPTPRDRPKVGARSAAP
jgi:hypothetical protein